MLETKCHRHKGDLKKNFCQKHTCVLQLPTGHGINHRGYEIMGAVSDSQSYKQKVNIVYESFSHVVLAVGYMDFILSMKQIKM